MFRVSYKVYGLKFEVSMQDISLKLKEFMENETWSCRMDFGCMTPEYVYRMWGGKFSMAEIEKGFVELRSHGVL